MKKIDEKISIVICAYLHGPQCLLHMLPLEILYGIIKKYNRQQYLKKLVRFYQHHKDQDFHWYRLAKHPAIDWNNYLYYFYGTVCEAYYLSKNPNITWDIIQNNMSKIKWDWNMISKNPNITWDIVIQNLGLPWNWYSLTKTVDIDFEKALFLHNAYYRFAEKLDWFYISKHPNTTWETINTHTYMKYWDNKGLALNPNIVKYLLTHKFFLPAKLNWDWVGKNPSITLKDINEHPNIFNNFNMISENPNVTWDYVMKNPDYDWSYEHLSRNPSITWNDIKNHPSITKYISNSVLLQFVNNPFLIVDKPFLIVEHQSNTKLYTFDIPHISSRFDKNQNNQNKTDNKKEWDWKFLSRKPDLTWEDIKKYRHAPWDIYQISKHPNITWHIILDNPTYEWSWMGISNNPNLKLDYILDWIYITNKFKKKESN